MGNPDAASRTIQTEASHEPRPSILGSWPYHQALGDVHRMIMTAPPYNPDITSRPAHCHQPFCSRPAASGIPARGRAVCCCSGPVPSLATSAPPPLYLRSISRLHQVRSNSQKEWSAHVGPYARERGRAGMSGDENFVFFRLRVWLFSLIFAV